jgi:nicotinate-nucleotide--dimethylbenzimidazole phosphoribosyltransferase
VSPRVVVLAADRDAVVRGVSALPLGWTAVASAASVAEGGALEAAGRAVGVPVEVVDVDVAGPRGPVSQPFDTGPALDEDTVDEALDRGRRLLGDLADSHDVIGVSSMGVGGTTTAAALVASVLGRSPVTVVSRGSGIDDLAWMRKTAALRDGLRLSRLAGVGPASPAVEHLRHLGSVDAAVTVGLLVEAAASKVPVVVDGPLTAAAGLLAQRVAPSTRHWWLAVDPAVDPLARTVWDEIGVARIAAGAEGAGLGAVMALAAVRAAAGVLASPTAARAWPQEAT